MEHSKQYEEYLKSKKWEEKRQERLAIDGYKCVMCGRPENRCRKGLSCHHISYKNLGKEDVYKDLVSLCPSCHLKIHAYYNRQKEAII